MMAVLDAINHGGKLSAVPAAETGADIAAILRLWPPQAEFAAALEQLVDRKVALEDEVAAVLDLRDGIEAGEVDRLALPGGISPQQEGPVVETLADDVRAQPVRGGLQGSDIVDREKRIVVLAEADLRTGEFLFDEAVAIEVIGGLGTERTRLPGSPSARALRRGCRSNNA